MATEQERWNQAERNTGNVMRGTQPNIAAGQAQKNTANAMKGTYSGNQGWHDNAYKNARDGHLAKNPGKEFTPNCDAKVCQGVLKAGGNPKDLKNSVAAHSPNAGNPKYAQGDRGKYGNTVVGAAVARNAADDPRASRQNIKPGHEMSRGAGQSQAQADRAAVGKSAAQGVSGQDKTPTPPKSPSPSTPNAQQMAAMHHYQNRSR